MSNGCPIEKNNKYSPPHDFGIIVCIILSIKFMWFILDPSPQFFLGDSNSYINTAIYGWIPPDRSFIYGYIIKTLAFLSRSLTSLVFAQIVASAVSCILIAKIIRLMNLPAHFIMAGALVCSLDPLQLFYERYVMAEAFGLMFLVFFLICWAHFFKKKDWRWIVYANIAGVLAVALRLSFLPIIQFCVIACPVIPGLFQYFTSKKNVRITARCVFSSLMVSMICFLLMHTGYKYLNGHVSKSKPAYNYESGFFLLASWSPLIQEDDFEDKALASIIVPPTYRDITLRESNRWSEDGIVARLVKNQPDRLAAEKLAGQIAKKIFLRDPIGVIRLGLTTYGHLWNKNSVFWVMKYDRGESKLPDAMLSDLATNYNLDARKIPFQDTLSTMYFFAARLWYRVLLISPIILFAAFIIGSQESRPFTLLLFCVSSIVILVSTMVATMPVVRYLHPLGWMVIPGILVLVEKLTFKVFGNKRLNDANQERIS